MKIVILLLTSMLIIGCSKKKEEKAAGNETTRTTIPTQILPADQFVQPAVKEVEDPAKVLVEVNGKKYTVADANADIDFKLLGVKQNISDEVRKQIRNEVTDFFIAQTILLEEADKLNIKPTEAEEAEIYNKIKDSRPEKNLETELKALPNGEARLKQQISNGVRINKLIQTVISNNVSVTDEEIKTCLENNKQIQESVKASHILIATKEGEDAKAKDEKKKKAEDIRKKLVEGANFEEMAKQFSDCPSKEMGGSLGVFPREQMVKEFADAAFSQKVDEIGNIVETKFGYHIILVKAHMTQNDVAKSMLTSQKAETFFREYISNIHKKSKIMDYRLAPQLTVSPAAPLAPAVKAEEKPKTEETKAKEDETQKDLPPLPNGN